MIKTVLFDLDGTLLPMDQDEFVKAYFGGIAKKLAPHGYEAKKAVDTIWQGTGVMIFNDGKKTNEKAFWDYFTSVYGNECLKDTPVFDDFYQREFDEIKKVCSLNKKANEVIKKIKQMGYRVALATNPIFPPLATLKRIKWAGIEPSEFELITTYDNSSFCKPNLKYYEEIVSKLGVKSEECLMVGNDVIDDMCVTKLGMKVFLVTDCLINKGSADINEYPHGNLDDLLQFVKKLR